MKALLTSSIGALALLACQVVGGFEEYARDDSGSASNDGESGDAGSPGGGTSFGGGLSNPTAGSAGGTATGGTNAGYGGAGGQAATSGGSPATAGTSGTDTNGGTGSGASSSGGSSTGGSSENGGGSPPTNEGGNDSAGMGGEAGSGPDCSYVIEKHPEIMPEYVPVCAPVSHTTHPPCGGQNYDFPASFETYTAPILPGYMVHALEHGGIAVLYNCPDGCAEDVARAQAWMDNRPEDLTCVGAPFRRRLLMAPDPELTTRWAAVSWGVIMRASCFDEATFSTFYDENYNHSPEDSCFFGTLPDVCAALAPGGS